MLESIEGNVLCAASILVSAVTLDALCALPASLTHENVSTSMRTTSLVLTMLLASPAIARRHSDHTEKTPPNSNSLVQRGLLGTLLVAAVFFSGNRCRVGGRNADAICSLVGASAIIFASVTNGATAGDGKLTHVQKNVAKEHTSALVGALCFYCGVRVVRNALLIPSEALAFKMQLDSYSTMGLAMASQTVSVLNAFSGACVAGFGGLVLLNHDLVYVLGSKGLCRSAAAISALVFAATLAAQLETFASYAKLPALFGDSACNGDPNVCETAFRARRQFVSMHSTSVQFASTLAIAVYSFCREKKTETRKQLFLQWNDYFNLEGISLLVTCLASLLAVFYYTDINNPSTSNIMLTLLLVSVPVALLNAPISGCLLHCGGQLLYYFERMSNDTFSLLYYTNLTMLLTSALLGIAAVLMLISHVLYSLPDRLYSTPVEWLTGACLVVLLSSQLFLTIATLGMTSGMTGASMHVQSWINSGIEFNVQHCVSIFFCGALYTVRYEHNILSQAWRAAVWFVPPLATGVVWLIMMQLEASDVVYTHWVDGSSFVIGLCAATVSWVGVGVFLST